LTITFTTHEPGVHESLTYKLWLYLKLPCVNL